MEGFNKKDFEKFVKEMWERLKKGEKKYGGEYRKADIKKAILEEATDLANYAFMLYLKTKDFTKKIK